ncbi:MAG: hypothetical protein Q8N23_16435 [Archangium sp.]|nr:hypothetical protein [Archangium sp.]MDP3154266.1 hypothetical protein [Archangium sp.]MDP3575954.1 hypothetical protein [Archangium sp.]
MLLALLPLVAEAKRHTDALISQHDNLTAGLALDKALTTIESEPSVSLHALTRSSLETKVEAYGRVDLQLLAMIDDARAGLKRRRGAAHRARGRSGCARAGRVVLRPRGEG